MAEKPPLPPEEQNAGLVNALKLISKVGRLTNPVTTALQVMEPKKVADATLDAIRPELDNSLYDKDAYEAWQKNLRLVTQELDDSNLYHGTTADIKTGLKYSKEGVLGEGIYLTPDIKYAESYAEGEGGNILPVKADIVNPLVVNIKRGEEPASHVLNKLGVEKNKASDIAEKAFEKKGNITKEISTRARKQGYDSIILKVDGKIQEILMYIPKNIKSVFTKRHGGSVMERNPYDYQPRAI
mgnify:CR=1 FL=1